jgi:hypothetical protein
VRVWTEEVREGCEAVEGGGQGRKDGDRHGKAVEGDGEGEGWGP